MRIALNAQFLQTPASGSGQYLLHLLHALKEIDQQNEYILLGAKPVAAERIAAIPFPYHVNSVPSFANRNENIEKLL
ncbi:MAG TPA: hypothetical protein DIU08_08550, partial [Ktedonobacter sp.]|nr:hypothetical protein [Ktedonobacter sp.]